MPGNEALAGMTDDVAALAEKLTEAQRGLLDDLCDCPGLFAGQYEFDGAMLEHLPNGLVTRSYEGASGFMGLAKAHPSPLGLAVRQHLERQSHDQ